MSQSPVSSLTRLLQKQQVDQAHKQPKSNLSSSTVIASQPSDEEDTSDITNTVSIEGVEVVYPGELDTGAGALPPRSPISIGGSFSGGFGGSTGGSTGGAPPIRAPVSSSYARRQPPQDNYFSSSLSSSIPYSVPNSNPHDSHSSSLPRHSGLPANVSMIGSIDIKSPKISSSTEIEPRFVISKQRVAQVQAANSYSKSLSINTMGNSSSSNGLFSKSRKSSVNDLGSFYNNSAAVYSPTNVETIPSSPSSISSSDSSMSRTRTGGSMADLKRFFRKNSSNSPKSSANPAAAAGTPTTATTLTSMSPVSAQFSMGSRERSGSVTSGSYISNITTPQTLPFSKRYSKFGDNLGAGAGGSVRLVRRLSDQKMFAVKEFRKKSMSETRREYAKKITSEYCIGSTLRHPNIIETIEIAYDNDRLLQVLEYCDYDLFAIVMSNKMSEPEIDCCFKQILTGIQYLHHMGLAHRDLKLDNCVINSDGIIKIIDFGSAVVFSYPFTQKLIESSGVVGSDPYLSPETLVFTKYDPRPVDVWSIAIIYCCMVLKKFPWKVPKLADSNFKLFCSGRNSDSLSSLLTRVKEDEPLEMKEMSKQIDEIDEAKKDNEEKPKDTTHLVGEARLLNSLPEHARPVIGRMVELAPALRATMDEVMNDPWVQSIESCFVEEVIDQTGISKHVIHKASNHTHTQVDQSEAHIASLEKKKKKANK